MKPFNYFLAIAILIPTSISAAPATLGVCDPSLRGKDELYKYMCNRGDGSIGWLYLGSRLGAGDPIFAIANRDTENAFLVLKRTMVYPGFYGYYDEPNKLNNPSTNCLLQVKRQSALPPQKVTANCRRLTVRMINESYRFWELDEDGFMRWLPVGEKPVYFNGEKQRMAGGYDSIIAEAFATLCPSRFMQIGGKI
jgi:hypothetical protein